MGSTTGLLCGRTITLFVFMAYFLVRPFSSTRSTRRMLTDRNSCLFIAFGILVFMIIVSSLVDW